MLQEVPDGALAELARTEGGPDTLALLARDQDTRRLLLLRAVLDAAEAADEALCAAADKARLRDAWSLLTESDRTGGDTRDARHPRTTDSDRADRADSTGPAGAAARADRTDRTDRADRADRADIVDRADPPGHVGRSGSTGGAGRPGDVGDADRAGRPGAVLPGSAGGVSSARALLLRPLTGAWAVRCLRGLLEPEGRAGAAGAPYPGDPGARPGGDELSRDLAHLGALAAAAAARAGLAFDLRLTARDGTLVLPSLGALRTADPGAATVRVTGRNGCLTLRQGSAPDVVVFLEAGYGAWSGSPAWSPAGALPGLTLDAAPMPLDDLDPYRGVRADPRHRTLSGPATLDDVARKRWLQAWSGTAAALRTGGERRQTEALALLRCLVPLEMPPGADGRGGCSATRREAFGALLSSTPPSPVAFAATLVHELQHAKLAALGEMVTLHQEDGEERYFAPWRPDPRPYDGLLQGAYAHLGLADFFQRRALTAEPAHRESAWVQHARYRAQVGAVLPALVGSPRLTARGRRFVDGMAAAHEAMATHPAPRGHTARAQAYLRAARTLWTQRQSSAPGPNE
ncbi:HEXXH motif-containing putative peptide modification protein [Streptomyces sp. NPDC026672]|uniref:aKG-HExxH-type peptide beta-hydroxylase n=1 Tax=unclassified Streptomyces TaxID=2593676 RepID=UPI0033C9E4A5